MDNISNLVYSEEVLDFVRHSNDFCRWIEQPVFSDRKLFLQEGLGILTGLYSRMINIPAIEPLLNETGEKFVTEEGWSAVYRKIADICGTRNDFTDIPNAEEYDRSELVIRKISEDIADIYQDIRDFLEIYRNSPEEIMHDALWECQSLFENNWGEKLLRATRAMHENYFSLLPGEEDTPENITGRSFRNIDTSDWILTKRQEEFGKEDQPISE